MEIETLYKYFKECTSVTTDSRNCPEGSMFIALKGDRFNGNAFARQALEEGCRYAVVDEPEYAAAGEFLQQFSFICLLSYDVYIKKLVIEKMIDDMKDKMPKPVSKAEKKNNAV